MVEEKGLAPAGAHRLAYASMGSGSPLVVLEAALGAPGEIWDTIMPEIARFTRVIRYDRAGLGESERAGRRRTLARAGAGGGGHQGDGRVVPGGSRGQALGAWLR